jgi:hypothetical protein
MSDPSSSQRPARSSLRAHDVGEVATRSELLKFVFRPQHTLHFRNRRLLVRRWVVESPSHPRRGRSFFMYVYLHRGAGRCCRVASGGASSPHGETGLKGVTEGRLR